VFKPEKSKYSRIPTKSELKPKYLDTKMSETLLKNPEDVKIENAKEEERLKL